METAQKLDIIETIKDGISIGMRNLVPIVVNVVLWFLTCWIPYLNVGTTIGLFTGIVAKASKGETISSTEIFDPQYRRFMGEYFLTVGLIMVGVMAGFIFVIVPGYVIAISWSFATLLVIDKGKNPIEAISLSNSATYGYKWRIFAIYFLLGLAGGFVSGILGRIPGIGNLLSLIIGLILLMTLIGLQASIYRQLTEEME